MERFELPEGWEWRSIESICHVLIGGTPRRDTSSYWGGNNTWVAISDLNEGIILSTRESITDEGVINSNVKLIEPGTLLMSFKLSIGKMAFAGKHLYTNEAIAALPIKASANLLPRFLYYALKVITVSEGATEASKGQTLNKDKVKALQIPIPPLPEQNRLVARIEAFTERIEASRKVQREAIADIEGMFERALHRVFSEDNTANWSEYPTADLFSMVSGQVDPRQKPYVHMPSVAPDNVEKGTGRLIGEIKTAGELELSSGKYLFGLEHVIYSKIRPALRKVCVPRFAGVCSADMYALKPNTKLISQDFLALSLLSPPFTSYAIDNSDRNAMPKINRKVLFGYRMRVPDLLTQEHLSDYLLGIRKRSDEIACLQRSVEVDFAALIPAILSKAFRGEL